MLPLCATLHLRNDLLQENMPIETLHQIAVLADKYDCTMALKHSATHWLNKFSDQQMEESPLLMVEAAYMLDHEAFSKITDTLVKRNAYEVFEDLDAERPLQGLHGMYLRFSIGQMQMKANTYEIVEFLKIAKVEAVKSLQLTVSTIALEATQHAVPGHGWLPWLRQTDEHISDPDECTARRDLAYKCLEKLNVSEIWLHRDAYGSADFSALLERIAEFNMPDIGEATNCTWTFCVQDCRDFLSSMNDMVKRLKREAQRSFVGVSLGEFKKGL